MCVLIIRNCSHRICDFHLKSSPFHTIIKRNAFAHGHELKFTCLFSWLTLPIDLISLYCIRISEFKFMNSLIIVTVFKFVLWSFETVWWSEILYNFLSFRYNITNRISPAHNATLRQNASGLFLLLYKKVSLYSYSIYFKLLILYKPIFVLVYSISY